MTARTRPAQAVDLGQAIGEDAGAASAISVAHLAPADNSRFWLSLLDAADVRHAAAPEHLQPRYRKLRRRLAARLARAVLAGAR
jgi:hypothetical protein